MAAGGSTGARSLTVGIRFSTVMTWTGIGQTSLRPSVTVQLRAIQTLSRPGLGSTSLAWNWYSSEV